MTLLSSSSSSILQFQSQFHPQNKTELNSKPLLLPKFQTPAFSKPTPSPKLKLQSISTTAQETPLQQNPTPPLQSHPNWEEFAKRISGEWDGFGADFTAGGDPVELPENVVPEAFREWEVRVFDWQTQCPTLASDTEPFDVSYKLIRLLPTVGCEADAATRHSVVERNAGAASAFGYCSSGCYLAVWPSGKSGVEVEHCFVDPRDREVRVRVVMVLVVEEEGLRLRGVRVFSEQWYGPWRNGEQLGGCAIRESGFAQGERLDVSEVVGDWEWRSFGITGFHVEGKDVFHQFAKDEPQKKVRDQLGLVALPKNLWCSFKEYEDGETYGEVGWLFDHGSAMTSRCVFLTDGRLKEMAIGKEIAISEGM